MEGGTSDSAPVQIREVTVQEIKWGTLISVQVTWKTDKPSTSKIEYGPTPSLGLATPVDTSLVTDHQMTIHGLKPETTYHFRVHSSTSPGLPSISGLQNFTTPSRKTTSFLEWILPSAFAQSFSTPLLITNISISQVTERSVMITWETNRPSDTLLEYSALQSPSETKGFSHPPLKPREKSGIESCYECHPKEKLGVTHPVGVRLKPGMKKNRDLPLGERETILCTTCHNPHGSKEKYLARKDWKRELCISCHDISIPAASQKAGPIRR